MGLKAGAVAEGLDEVDEDLESDRKRVQLAAGQLAKPSDAASASPSALQGSHHESGGENKSLNKLSSKGEVEAEECTPDDAVEARRANAAETPPDRSFKSMSHHLHIRLLVSYVTACTASIFFRNVPFPTTLQCGTLQHRDRQILTC